MGCVLIMKKGVGSVIAPTANVATNEANPEICIGSTDGAFVEPCFSIRAVESFAKVILSVSADWASTTSPLLEAGAVEHMLTEYGKQSCRLVHTF